MNAMKSIGIVFIFLLTACAPRANLEAPPTLGMPMGAEVSSSAKSTATASQDQAKNKAEEIPGNKTTSLAAGKTKAAATAAAGAVSSWEISGAMAARSKNKGWSASLNWLQQGLSQYQIRLFGPLGSGTVLINKKGRAITYRDGPKTVTSSNADELLKQQTGVRLPVNNLYYWVRGIPAPGAIQAEKRDSANHLMVLKQGGYTIEYANYTTVGKVILPTHIKLQGNGVFIKLVIKRWRI